MKRELLVHAKKYIPQLVLINALQYAGSLVFVGYFFIFKSLVDGGIIGREAAVITRDILLLIGLAVVREVLDYAANYLKTSAQENINRDVQLIVYSHALRLHASAYSAMTTGGLINKVIGESPSVSAVLTQWSIEVLKEPFRAAVLLSVLFYFDTRLTLAFIAFILPAAAVTRFIANRLDNFFDYFYEKKSQILSRVQETLSSVDIVKAFVRERAEEERFDRLASSLIANDLKLSRTSLLASPVNEITKVCALGFLVFIGSKELRDGSITAGTLTLFIASALSVFQSAASMSYIYTGLRNSLIGARRVFEFLNMGEESGGGTIEARGETKGSLELRDVAFSYNERVPLFKNLYLTVDKGEFIAVIGESGSGKTTIAKLLLRFYEPSSGKISWGGVSAADFKLYSLRERIGTVFQENIIFNGTILENITYAKPDAPLVEAREAARAADIDEFISSLGCGYETIVGERGVCLSGGQRQRLSIARALMTDPDLLILDEATSFVDPESEGRILASVREMRRGKKTLLLTHRISTLRFADKAYRLENGVLRRHE